MRQLSARERLSPAHPSALTDQELQASLKIVFGSGELAAALPEEFVEGLLRRRVVSAVDQGDEVFDAIWVFQDAPDFNVFQPRLADAKVATPVKLGWMCVWIFNDYLAEHMAKGEQGAAAVCVLTDRVPQQGTLEPPMLAGHVAAMAIWRDIYFALSALGAVVQREAVAPLSRWKACPSATLTSLRVRVKRCWQICFGARGGPSG